MGPVTARDGALGGTSADGSLAGGGGGGGYTTGGGGGTASDFGGHGGGGGGGGFISSPRLSQGQQIDAKGYWGLGHTDGIVIITPVFG
ncbi:MAG: hypothetical protein ABJA74_04265 [Lapillicoccus sp.]